MTLRILIVDDYEVVRRGIRTLLETEPGWEVCGEASTGPMAVEAAFRLKPDLVVLDLSLPELHGLEVARRILQRHPDTEILVLTMHASEELIRQVLRAGAHGYVLKSDAGEQLVTAVRSLQHRKPFLTARVTEVVLDGFLKGVADDAVGEALTPREREVLQLVAEGRSSKSIAAGLGVTVKTIESHRASLMRKLHLRTVADLVRYAVRNGLVEA
ncbi:MAG TPA: response regulator transcription factor [Gemmatimonadales bacterium]|nr:response regulator transcription factor [Gemmatimonadales bacterium]